jgi:hypothetical protein
MIRTRNVLSGDRYATRPGQVVATGTICQCSNTLLWQSLPPLGFREILLSCSNNNLHGSFRLSYGPWRADEGPLPFLRYRCCVVRRAAENLLPSPLGGEGLGVRGFPLVSSQNPYSRPCPPRGEGGQNRCRSPNDFQGHTLLLSQIDVTREVEVLRRQRVWISRQR